MSPTALTLAKDLSWDVAPESSATHGSHLRRVRDGEAVLRVGERSRTRLSSSRRARVRRVLRERGERVGDDDVGTRARRRTRGEVWEVSVRRTRTRLWMDTSRNGAGGV